MAKRPCFQCMETGHMARDCPKRPKDARTLEDEDDDDEPAAMMLEWEEVRNGGSGRREGAADFELAVSNSFEVMNSDSGEDSETSDSGDSDVESNARRPPGMDTSHAPDNCTET